MNERIKKLRKELGLSGEKFGERIGVGKTAISRLENGSNNVTEQTFKSICREFNVNEEWLKTGEGEMFKPAEDKFTAYLARIDFGNDDLIKDLIEVYMELDSTSKDALRKLADNMAEKRNKRRQM